MAQDLLDNCEDHEKLKIVDLDKFPKNIDKACAKAREYALSMTGRRVKLFTKGKAIDGEVQRGTKQINNYSSRFQREESVSIWCENIDLYFLGQGYPMYFDFMKSSIVVLLMIFVSSGAFNIFTNAFIGTDCKDSASIRALAESGGHNIEDICELSWTTLMSLANKRSNANFILTQDMMNLLTVLTIICILQYLRTNQRALNELCDELLISPSDYTIWITGIPKYLASDDTVIEQAIKAEIETQARENYFGKDQANIKNLRHFQVVDVTVCYDLSKISQLTKERESIIAIICELKVRLIDLEKSTNGGDAVDAEKEKENEKRNLKTQIGLHEKELRDIKETITNKKREYFEGTRNSANRNNADFSGHAFVTMNTEKAKDMLIAAQNQSSGIWSSLKFWSSSEDQIRINAKKIRINGAIVNVLPAPEPTDVNWNHLVVTPREQFWRNVASDCTTFLLLSVNFCIILFLLNIQQEGTKKITTIDEKGVKHVKLPQQTYQIRAIALVISFVIPALNSTLQYCLTKLSLFEKHHRKTREIASLGKKLAIAQFINTAIITFIIKVMLDFFNDPKQAEHNIFMNGGLIFNQQYVFVTSSVISAVSTFVDGGRWYKVLVRWYTDKSVLTKRMLNELYEEPTHNLASDYSSLMKTIMVTAFYAPLIPVGIIISIVGIAVLYLIQKYKISNYRTIRYSMSNLISIEMIELMEYILPIYCIANLVYEYLLIPGTKVSLFSLLGIGLSIANICLPMDYINTILFYVRPCPPLKDTYNDNIRNFQFDYHRANPATDDIARKKYVDEELSRIQNKSF